MDDSGHIPVWSGQRVERTNARGRHRYCAPFKAWIVEQALVPGMSVAGLAMRNQVNANQLRRWVLLHRRGPCALPRAPMLLPVTTTAPAAVASPDVAIEIEVAGVVVRMRAGVDPMMLRTVLDVLRGASR